MYDDFIAVYLHEDTFVPRVAKGWKFEGSLRVKYPNDVDSLIMKDTVLTS